MSRTIINWAPSPMMNVAATVANTTNPSHASSSTDAESPPLYIGTTMRRYTAVYLRIVVPMYRGGDSASVELDAWLGFVVFATVAATFIIGLGAQFMIVRDIV